MTTSWTNIGKPTGTAYTNVPKPSGIDHTISTLIGSPIGLLLALTYSTTTSVITGIWTDIPKPSGTLYTNIPKAT